jgi:hypothetical protein
MFLQYFKKKENKDKNLANSLYFQIIDFKNRLLQDYPDLIKNDFKTSFELSSILLFVFFYELKNNLDYVDTKQEMMNIFVKDLDYSLRKNGISDMAIGKYVKGYIKKFYYRVKKLEKIFDKKDQENFALFMESADIFLKKKTNKANKFSINLYNILKNLSADIKKNKLKNLTILNFYN